MINTQNQVSMRKIRSRRKGNRNSVVPGGIMNSQLQYISLIGLALILFMILIGNIMILIPRSGFILDLDIDRYTIIIDVNKNGEIRIQGKQVSLNEIAQKIEFLQNGKFNECILIKGESDASYGTIMHVLLNVQKSGYRNVSFLVRN
ncbi:biopolymer transporter ExbD [Candidatus Liberibacter africanus]|uniref:Biopolymer transport protein ExbD/TolR n=1 Tax=Candidatus Liberibacter africanus PTSAPSY TaxID=1277257 RepID=A0A0G3I994_LIBAF|nr:biopolymer transporter ExbD [Candidatus Liberibacter africanus]AKK20352.1 hypothetical protein G293_03620 [Candidatus Liberibacter africanus PTSAPSY]QTP64096.1 biopolymer transporter ExbD [Candidatus Liberibacter africanus]